MICGCYRCCEMHSCCVSPSSPVQKILHSTMTHNLFKRPSQREQEAVQRRQAARSRFQAGLRSKSTDQPGVGRGATGGRGAAAVGGIFGNSRNSSGRPVGGSPTTARKAGGATGTGGSPLTARRGSAPVLSSGVQSTLANAAAAGKDVNQLTATIEQLRAGSELSQAQLKAMYDQMCALSAQVDQLKGQNQPT